MVTTLEDLEKRARRLSLYGGPSEKVALLVESLIAHLRQSQPAAVDAKDVLTVRAAARQRRPLDGTDAQALEGALASTETKLTAAEQRIAELEANGRILTKANSDCAEQYETMRADLEAKSAECERLRGEVEQQRADSKQWRDRIRSALSMVDGDWSCIEKTNAVWEADLAQFKIELARVTKERDEAISQRVTKADLGVMQGMLDDLRSADAAIAEAKAGLAARGAVLPSVATIVECDDTDGKYWEVKAGELHIGNYTDYGAAVSVRQAVNRVRANWPAAPPTTAPADKPTREEATAWAKEGAPSPSVLAWSEIHRGPLDPSEAVRLAQTWADDFCCEADDEACIKLADLLMRTADTARRVAIEDARVAAISEIGRLPVGMWKQVIADRVGGSIHTLITQPRDGEEKP